MNMAFDYLQTEHIGFLLLEKFSMLSFSAALEPLRMANRLSGKVLYKWYIYGNNNQSVLASNGTVFTPTRKMDDIDNLNILFVVAGTGAVHAGNEQLFNWLRKLVRKGTNIGATSTGSLLLAQAGILKDRTCTIHWENKASFSEQYPYINVTDELFEIDRNIITCSGGLAGLDMMLHLINITHGSELSQDIADQSIHPTIRSAHYNQRMTVQLRHKIRHPRLLKALELMQENIEEILTSKEISQLIGLSTRQLERLFQEQMQVSPASYYMNLRLQRANYLLRQSTLSILQIGIATGFNSNSYFTHCYRNRYGCTPYEERKK